MKTNKTLKVLATSAMLASVAAPFGAGVVSANSTNFVKEIKSVSSDYKGTITTLYIQEDDTDITTGDTFRVVLPAGVKWDGTPAVANAQQVTKLSDQVLEIKASDISGKTAIQVPLAVEFDGVTAGEQKLQVEAMDSTITSGSYTFAVVGSGNTTATVDDVKSVGKGSAEVGGTIRIDETAIGSIDFKSGAKTLKVKLAPNFEWNETEMKKSGAITLGGGLVGGNIDKISVDGRTLEVTISNGGNKTTTRGSIYIKPVLKVTNDAQYGDVTASISGDGFTDQDVTVAQYADYTAKIKVDEVKELLSGKVDDVDTKTGKITIEEGVAGSFIGGRDLTLQLPSWVKVLKVTEESNNGAFNGVTYDADDNEVTITPKETSKTKGKIEIKLQLSIQGDKTGDIEAVLKGSGIKEEKVVIAKAKAPVTVESAEAAKVKIGVQNQDAPDIILTEALKGAFEKSVESIATDDITKIEKASSNGEIRVKLPTGVTFASVPKVEVIEGNLEIEQDNITRAEDNQVLVIPVKSESTKPSKIKISGVKLTVDRTVPEGAVTAKVMGSAVIENAGSGKGKFNVEDAIKFDLAQTVTPAPSDTTATNIVFKLNSKTFTVDGKEMTMDAAPLVGWDRAYLPVRFAANALNVADDQIIWDDKTNTFTIFKGDRVITGKVGDKFLTVNGVKVPMDVPVWRNKVQTNNRVMVPIRYLANALNANIEWNKETSEITIQAKK